MSEYETTYDGQHIAKEKPFGACVVVYRETANGREFLIMHRGHESGADYEGDWAWTPPAGSRWPGEAIDDCARRELREETGLNLPLIAAAYTDEAFATYVVRVEPDCVIILNEEHDRLEWVSAADAKLRCLPAAVAAEIDAALAIIDQL